MDEKFVSVERSVLLPDHYIEILLGGQRGSLVFGELEDALIYADLFE